jgi:hypothetical protein
MLTDFKQFLAKNRQNTPSENLIGCIISHSGSQWLCGLRLGSVATHSLGLRVGIPPRHGCLSVASVVCCHVEVSALDLSLIQRSPTKCGVSECDCEASIMRRPWPTRGCCAMEKRKVHLQQTNGEHEIADSIHKLNTFTTNLSTIY